MNSFDFTPYDCIGFDLDNTLAEYEVFELTKLIYSILSKLMVNTFSCYKSVDLFKPLEDDIDFIRKGLTIDIERGNIVSLADDGTILRASHGTRLLSAAEITNTYGPQRMWDIGAVHCDDFLATWNGQLAEKIRSSLDYFDISVPLLFARCIDSVADMNLKPSCVWANVFECICTLFSKDEWGYSNEGYYGSLQQNPHKYVKKRSPEFLNWLDSLKKSNKILFLVTGSDCDYAEFIASNALGADWKKYFDVIVFFARKPGFFVQNRDFKRIEPESHIVPPEKLQLGQSYREGNWTNLYQLFAKSLKKDNPKCLYMGDNLIQDVYAPAKYQCCDTVAVIKELTHFEQVADKNLFVSHRWGSMMHDKVIDKPTIWVKILNNYATIHVPSLECFVSR